MNIIRFFKFKLQFWRDFADKEVVRHRPWPILILAIAHLLVPLVNLFFAAWLLHVSWVPYFVDFVLHGSVYDRFLTFAVPWFAGASIYAFKRWSYFVFQALVLVVLVNNYFLWKHDPGIFSFSMLITTYVINAIIVTYFMLPAVRAPYFDRKLRWWESQTRYIVRQKAWFWVGEKRFDAILKNLSRDGAFIEVTRPIGPAFELELMFRVMGQLVEVPVEVVHIFKNRKNPGYGLHFLHTPETLRLMRGIVADLKASNTPLTAPPENLKKDFKNWAYTLLTTGKGWVPELPNSKSPKSSNSKSRKKVA